MTQDKAVRELILETAEQAVLEKGFGALTIDELINSASITRNTFYTHFRSMNQLARELLERYVEHDEATLDSLFACSNELADDPLEAFLVALTLFAEMVGDMPAGHPGCLVATYCYQDRLFDKEIREINRRAALRWRNRFRKIFDDIAVQFPSRLDIDLNDLSDMFSAVAEGGIILSRALKEPDVFARQVHMFRRFVKLVFAPAPAAA